LGIVPKKFLGIGSEELFAGNSQDFSQIFAGFLQNWQQEIPWMEL